MFDSEKKMNVYKVTFLPSALSKPGTSFEPEYVIAKSGSDVTYSYYRKQYCDRTVKSVEEIFKNIRIIEEGYDHYKDLC